MDNQNQREFAWDDTIENDSPDFILLPEGDYSFTVTKFERARHNGSEKLPPCNKAIVDIRIDTAEGSTTIKHNLFLHSITEGMLCAFFTAIGQRKHGEKLKMNWNAIIGATGKCHVYIDTWIGNDGTEKHSNKIKNFYDPDDIAPTTAAPAGFVPTNAAMPFTPGRF